MFSKKITKIFEEACDNIYDYKLWFSGAFKTLKHYNQRKTATSAWPMACVSVLLFHWLIADESRKPLSTLFTFPIQSGDSNGAEITHFTFNSYHVASFLLPIYTMLFTQAGHVPGSVNQS